MLLVPGQRNPGRTRRRNRGKLTIMKLASQLTATAKPTPFALLALSNTSEGSVQMSGPYDKPKMIT